MRDEQRESIYCNVASIEVSLYDFKILVGLKRTENKSVDEEEDYDAEIIMSPQHAKAFLELMHSSVLNYEKTFGQIPGPPKGDEENV